MTTPYLRQRNINRFYNQPTIEELLNASKGSENWTPNQYSNDPHYSSVEPELFQYLVEEVLDK